MDPIKIIKYRKNTFNKHSRESFQYMSSLKTK